MRVCCWIETLGGYTAYNAKVSEVPQILASTDHIQEPCRCCETIRLGTTKTNQARNVQEICNFEFDRSGISKAYSILQEIDAHEPRVFLRVDQR